jgi:hypothetical protein
MILPDLFGFFYGQVNDKRRKQVKNDLHGENGNIIGFKNIKELFNVEWQFHNVLPAARSAISLFSLLIAIRGESDVCQENSTPEICPHFDLEEALIPNKFVRLFTKLVIKQPGCKENECGKYKHDQQLNSGCSLNRLLCFDSTYLTGQFPAFSLKNSG